MSEILFDTNVLLDIATADATWLAWSEGQFRAAAAQGPILINPIIYAELAPAFATRSDLDRWLDPAVFQPPVAVCRRLASGAKRGTHYSVAGDTIRLKGRSEGAWILVSHSHRDFEKKTRSIHYELERRACIF